MIVSPVQRTGRASSEAAAALVAQLPAAFELSAAVIDFSERAVLGGDLCVFVPAGGPRLAATGCPSRCATSFGGGFARFMAAGSG